MSGPASPVLIGLPVRAPVSTGSSPLVIFLVLLLIGPMLALFVIVLHRYCVTAFLLAIMEVLIRVHAMVRVPCDAPGGVGTLCLLVVVALHHLIVVVFALLLVFVIFIALFFLYVGILFSFLVVHDEGSATRRAEIVIGCLVLLAPVKLIVAAAVPVAASSEVVVIFKVFIIEHKGLGGGPDSATASAADHGSNV